MENEESKHHTRTKQIESVFRMILLLILAIIIGWKIIVSPLNFDFSDLLSLLLAIFAIGLSVAFYLKATQTSNTFYDNTYKFTQDVSVLLGRIEAGFGERLKHLDEGYSGLVGKMGSPIANMDTEGPEKRMEAEKQKLLAEIEKKNEIIQHIMEKAKLEEKEKIEVLKSLEEREESIRKIEGELQYLREIPNNWWEQVQLSRMTPQAQQILFSLAKLLTKEEIAFVAKAPIEDIQKRIELGFRMPRMLANDAAAAGYVTGDSKLTESGARWLQILIQMD